VGLRAVLDAVVKREILGHHRCQFSKMLKMWMYKIIFMGVKRVLL
jgi:hypothetical protein